jgi:hypothetical protein
VPSVNGKDLRDARARPMRGGRAGSWIERAREARGFVKRGARRE